jgi:hypothetical protein
MMHMKGKRKGLGQANVFTGRALDMACMLVLGARLIAVDTLGGERSGQPSKVVALAHRIFLAWWKWGITERTM